MKTALLSDAHLGSFGSNPEKITALLKNISCDRLIILGDMYDLYVADYSNLPDIFDIINENDGIKEYYYILGNHDLKIDKYKIENIYKTNKFKGFSDILCLNNDIYIHGHQYDLSMKICNPETFCKIQEYIERKINFNLQRWLMRYFGWFINWLNNNLGEKISKDYPGKMIYFGHTHSAGTGINWINTGCMTDDNFNWVEVEGNIVSFKIEV